MSPTLPIAAALLLCGCANRIIPLQHITEQKEPQDRQTARGQYSPDVLIVSYSAGDDSIKAALERKADELGAKIVYEYKNFNMMAIRRPDGMTMSQAIETFSKEEGVLNVVEDQMCEIESNDYSAAQ